MLSGEVGPKNNKYYYHIQTKYNTKHKHFVAYVATLTSKNIYKIIIDKKINIQKICSHNISLINIK